MNAVILTSKEKIVIVEKLHKAQNHLQYVISKAIEAGKKAGIYAPGFDYPAKQAAWVLTELHEILELLNKD